MKTPVIACNYAVFRHFINRLGDKPITGRFFYVGRHDDLRGIAFKSDIIKLSVLYNDKDAIDNQVLSRSLRVIELYELEVYESFIEAHKCT